MADAFQSHAFESTAFELITDVLEQYQLAANASADVFGGTNPAAARAQSFLHTDAYISSVDLLIVKVGSPVDNLIVEIQTDSSSKPSGVVVGTSVVTVAANIGTSIAWYTFAVDAGVTPGVKYWLVVRRDGSASTINFIRWRGNSADLYASGGASIYDGSTGLWGAETTNDRAFKTYHPERRRGPILVMPPPDRTR